MSAKFFQFKKNLFITILLLVIFVLPNNALAENLLTVGSASSSLSGTDSAIFANIGSISATTTSLIRLQKNGVDLFKVDSTGNVTMGNFLTSINASNVSNGAFGSLSGGGNYSFPGSLGIGTMTPAARLNIYSTSSIEEMFRLSDASGSSAANKYINWYSNNGGTTLTDFARIGAGYGSDYINSFMAFSVADGARVLRERVRINVNGNVGIGTTNPQQKLHIYGATAPGFYLTNSASGETPSDGYIFQLNGADTFMGNRENGALYLYTANSLAKGLTILNTGNVGIGTTTPQVTLDVNGLIKMRSSQITTTSDVINKGYLDSALETLSSSTNALNYWAANGTNIYNKNTGNVGIGTTAPANKLDVALGSISIGSSNISNGLQSSLKIYSFDNGAQQLGTLAADYADSLRTVHLFGNSNTNQIKIDTSASNGRIILFPGTGNVGIGTTTPITPLNVIGKWQYNLAGTIYSQDNSFSLDLAGINVDSLKVYKDLYSTTGVLKTDGTGDNWLLGNVGIGITNPGAKLDVFGSFRLSNLASSTSFTGLAISPNGDVGKISLSKSAVKEEAVYNVATTAYQTFMSSPSYVDNYHAKLRITTYATDSLISGNVMVVEVYGSKNYVPTVSVVATQNSTGASASGIQYFRVAYPSALNNGAPVHLEFNTASTANRYIKVEVLDSENLNLLPAVNGSLYTSSNQSVNTPLVYYNGTVTNKTIYGSVSGSAGSSAYSTYGSYAGFSASNGTDKTGLWAYIGEIYLAYSSTYRFGQSWNIELKIKENANNTSKPVNLFDDAQLILKGRMPVSTDANAFNTTIPEFSVELNGNNLELTKDDIAMMVASSNTSAKSVRLYVRLKSANTNYVFTPINRYGASYSSTGVISTGYCYFNSVTGAVGPLPSPASGQGSIVYAVQGENSNFWRSNNDNIFNLNTGNVGINTSTPGSLLAVGNNLGLTTGGIIFNSDSTRWLDMTGTNEDSLRLSKNIRLGDAARNVALGLGTNVPNRASLTLNSTAGNPADIIFKNGSATIGNYGQWAISSRNGSSDYRFSIWRGSENGGVSTESEMFTISPSGNVGIGTTNPQVKLGVSGSASGNAYLFNVNNLSGQANDSAEIGFRISNSEGVTPFASIRATRIGAAGYGNETDLSFLTSNTASTLAEKMRITGSGNVGVGTTTPDAKLNVNGNFHVSGAFSSVVFDKLADVSGSRIVMADSSGALYATSTSVATGLPSPSGISGYTLRSDGTSWVANNLLYNNGTNVGIGTTAPGAKLDVFGTNSAMVFRTVSPSGQIQFYNWSDGKNYIESTNANNTASQPLYFTGYGGGAGTFSFSGNVGIGTTAPNNNLEVRGASGLRISDPANIYRGILIFGNLNNGWNSGIRAYDSGDAEMRIWHANASGQIVLATGYNGETTTAMPTDGLFIDQNKVGIGYASPAAATGKLVVNGNVGIGTTTPSAKLTVAGGNIFITDAVITSSTPHAAITKTYLDSALGTLSSDLSASTTASNYWLANGANIYNKNTGNVGIGTVNPGSKLDVLSSGTANTAADAFGTAANFVSPTPSAQTSILSIASNDAVAANMGGVLGFGGRYSGTGYANWASIKGLKADATSGNYGGYLSFWTRLHGTVSAERMRIASNGNVGIGTTNPLTNLHVSGGAGLASFTGAARGLMTLVTPYDNSSYTALDFLYSNSNRPVARIGTKVTDSGSYLNFGTSNYYDLGITNAAMVIDPYGNVGIGITNPGYKLQVAGEGSFLNGASASQVHGVSTPTQLTDTANKSYVDTGLATKLTAMSNSSAVDVNALGDNFLLYGGSTGAWLNRGPSGHNGGAILHVPTHPGGYYSDLWFDTANNRVYTRATNATAIGGWDQLITASTLGASSGWIVNGTTVYNSNSGNVGISTTNPLAKLQIGTDYTGEPITLGTLTPELLVMGAQNNTSDDSVLRLVRPTTPSVAYPASVDFKIKRYDATYPYPRTQLTIGLKASGSYDTGDVVDVLTLRDNGNVGIGTTTPSASLDIFGNFKITSGGLVYNTNNSYRFNFSDIFGDHNSLIAQGDINTAGVLETAGTDRPNYMLGKLGVGTSNPGGKAEIAQGMSDYNNSFTEPHLKLKALNTVDNTGFVGITYDASTSANYGWSSGALRSTNGQSSFVWKYHNNSAAGVEYMRIASNGSLVVDKLKGTGNRIVLADSTGSLYATSTSNVFAFSSSTPLNMNGGDIRNVNKLTVGTIDPLYRINGTNYSSFASAIVGGVKEEYLGRAKISQARGKEYEYRIDFTKLSAPNELWVWRQTVDFSPENVEVSLTPYGAFANIYYIIEDEAIVLRADRPATVSYRLVGKRIDWQNWPTRAKDQQEKPSFIINNGKVIK